MSSLTEGPALDDVDGPAIGGTRPASGSRAEQLREKHAKRKKVLKRAIPEYDGDVVVHYKRLGKKQLTEITNRTRTAAAQNAEILATACKEVFIRDLKTGKLIPAREDIDITEPVRFDGHLADMFGKKADSPGQIVTVMYADAVAIAAHAKAVYDWQTGEGLEGADGLDDEEAEDLLGEADAAT